MIPLFMIIGGAVILAVIAVHASIEAHRTTLRTRELAEDLQTVTQVLLVVARGALDSETAEKLADVVGILGWGPRDDLAELARALDERPPAQLLKLRT